MQRKTDNHGRLKVSLHGMNERTRKMISGYLELCCKDIAYVVGESESEAEIIDIDLSYSREMLEKNLSKPAIKPIIVLSINEVLLDQVIYVKKPVEVHSIVTAIKKVKTKLLKERKLKALHKKYKDKTSQAKEAVKDEAVELRLVKKKILPTKIVAKKIKSRVDSSDSPAVKVKKLKPQVRKKNQEAKAVASLAASVSGIEVNGLLDGFLNGSGTLDSLITEKHEDTPSNNRRTVRYATHSIKAKIVRKSLLGSKKSFDVRVLNVSSKGALIKAEPAVKLKLKLKVILTICFDPEHIFVAHGVIVRAGDGEFYGLQFLNYQHELADYLVEGGGSFSII